MDVIVRRTVPQPRAEAYQVYWYFAAERHRIFDRRSRGEQGPWTEDPILATFKFCNAFRALDRVSQYLIRDVIYGTTDTPPEDTLFQIILFRLFSRVETWRGITRLLGHAPTVADLLSGDLLRAIEGVKQLNGRLYTGAFILCATDAYGCNSKHENHIQLLVDMFVRHGIGARLLEAESLGELYEIIHQFPLMGDFMSYQIAVDLNYSALFAFSEDSFTRPGPGAVRGLRKVFVDFGDYSPEDLIRRMVDSQEAEFQRFGLEFRGLFGRPLHAIDCQGLFCETDKYCREAIPQLGSNRKRIKARFVASQEPLDLYFPPKWGLNFQLSRPPRGGAF